ncbi:DUF1732 domain-containing protein [Anaerobacillus sp. HL2]|nr:DUF1732 domain-containing protein [Anaerobacillus sp. HL2]
MNGWLKRVQDFLTGKLDIEENRLLTDSYFADKANVDEELTRLNSRNESIFDDCIEQRNDLAVGRKLDFHSARNES